MGATWYNNYKAMQFAKGVTSGVTSPQDAASNAAKLKSAREYNARLLDNPINDPWDGRDPVASAQWSAYAKQLTGSSAMARIRIPSIRAELAIEHGTSDEVLARSAGHMFGTSLPVGGPSTHAGIAAHRALPNFTAFDSLPEMKIGDEFFIDVFGETLAYRVTSIKTVLPEAKNMLPRTEGVDQVTLVTCTPYAVNSHRLLVTGERIPLAKADAGAAQWQPKPWQLEIQPWMITRLVLSAIVLLLIVGSLVRWWVVDRRAKGRRRSSPRG